MVEERQRPNPDNLLARIQAEEKKQARGRLKIFLGYAAGVGKTYAMLEAARQRKTEGLDVVVAYVETHGRSETEALLAGLEVLPRGQIEYRDRSLPEMDVDAVLARRPRLALIDELAHTNVPGSRHPKRYQDVQEILDAGIDVYTTLNVQHLESLNDVVAQITGVVVRETLPDRVVDEANEIELIDLPPAELQQRLRNGKVYVPDQAARAIQKFFRTGNLTALRELMMRSGAERVDEQVRAYMELEAIPGPWPTKERLLVCVSPSPLSERLVRSARRLAGELNADWMAVYVETPEHYRLPQNQKDQVFHNLQLAEELGGKVITLPGHSIVDVVLDYAHQHNVTRIIAGKPIRPRWRDLLQGSLVDRLMRVSSPIDVFVISGGLEEQPSGWERPSAQSQNLWKRMAQSLALVVAATLLSEFVRPLFSPTNLVMIYLLVVVLSAVYLGREASFVAAILSVLAFDYFFVPPRLTLAVTDTEYIFTFLVLLIVGLVISRLTVRVREQAEAAIHRGKQITELYALSRDLAVALDLEAVLQAILVHVGQTLSKEVAVFLPGGAETVEPRAISPGFEPDEHRIAVATWVFRHGQLAGYGTDTLASENILCLPLKTARGVIGVLGVGLFETGYVLSPDQRELLQAFSSQSALAIERVQLVAKAQQTELLQSAEKLRSTLFNMISHDLRTPLVSITGALSSWKKGVNFDEATRSKLIENASGEAERLNRLVGNLLDMTRIEAGAVHVNSKPCDVQDVIATTLEQMEEWLDDRPVKVDVPDDTPLVTMDFVLMVQVLTNLLDNAIKYSPPDSPIDIEARLAGEDLLIWVMDRGMGIPPSDLGQVFDKFYRVQRPDNVRGSGLGLSICKGIVEAHGGRIWALNREGGGTTFALMIPLTLRQERMG